MHKVLHAKYLILTILTLLILLSLVNCPMSLAPNDSQPEPKYLYFADLDYKRIKRVNLIDGTTDTIIDSFSQFASIGIDKKNENLYWIDNTGSSSAIKRANLDGSEPVTLLSGLNQCYALQVDNTHDKYIGAIIMITLFGVLILTVPT
jgi:hypothetical protein